MPSHDEEFAGASDILSRDAFYDVPIPSLIWSRSYLILRRPTSSLTPTEDNKRASRYSRLEVSWDVDAAILKFLGSAPGHNYNVASCVGTDIVLFNNAYEKCSIGVGSVPRPVPETELSRKHRRLIEADRREIIIYGTYLNECLSYNIRMRINIRNDLFTFSIVASPLDGSRFPTPNTRHNFDALTIAFWDEYSKFVQTSYPFRRHFFKRSLQGVFADSRGVILASASMVDDSDPTDPPMGWADPIVRRLAPILDPYDRADLTATYVLDERALTVTAFGGATTIKHRAPIRFVVCVDSEILRGREENWARQMGVFLIRSHTMTTMRLAALLDMKLLRQTSAELAKVEEFKSNARKLIADYDNDDFEGASAAAAVGSLIAKLSRLDKDFNSYSAAGTDLIARIELSLSYIEEFKSNIEALRLSPLCQNHFIVKADDSDQLKTLERFLQRLRKNYDRSLAEVAVIDKNFSRVYARSILRLIAEVQENGEMVLIGVLVPYYLISIVSHVFGAPETYLWRIIYVSIWTSCAFYAYFRRRVATIRSQSARRQLRFRIFLLCFFINIILVFAIKYSLLVEKKFNSIF